MIQKFNEWDSNLNEGFDMDNSFYEKYETSILFFEDKLTKEIPGFNGIDFWDKLDKLEVQEYMENSLMKFFDSKLNLFYTGKYINGDAQLTPLGVDITNSALKAKHEILKQSPLSSYSIVRQAFFHHAVSHNWQEYKNIYLKWIDYIFRHRGKLRLGKFGV